VERLWGDNRMRPSIVGKSGACAGVGPWKTGLLYISTLADLRPGTRRLLDVQGKVIGNENEAKSCSKAD
jgi:hypothetical protein